MNEEKLYTKWKQYRRRVGSPKDFTVRVMNRLNAGESLTRPVSWIWREELSIRLLRWGTALILVLVGLFRLSFITATILAP